MLALILYGATQKLTRQGGIAHALAHTREDSCRRGLDRPKRPGLLRLRPPLKLKADTSTVPSRAYLASV
jgi:hypothetical protein